jgi:hypothetical protein
MRVFTRQSLQQRAGTIGAVQLVRLHDPGRRPVSWTEIIRDGQFAVFAKDGASGVPCEADGSRLADPGAATCAIFESIAEARAFCEAGVQAHPSLRFDVFDAAGRTQPPLLTIVHPDRAAAIETSPRQMRTRRVIAWLLILGGIPLIVFAYVSARERDIILPAFFGVNMILIGLRLLWMNLALRETERTRAERLHRLER